MTDPNISPPWHPERLAARLPFLRRRALLTQAVRAFFTARGYTEVETSYAVPTPGEEVHLQAFATERMFPDGKRQPLFLHTSPEFAMKKLLAGGSGPIFQLARVWRNNEDSPRHAAEFTMLEWYRPGATMDDLIEECAALLRATLPPTVTCQGITHQTTRPDRITLADAFAQHCQADLLATAGNAKALAAAAGVTLRAGEDWEDLFFRLLLTHIEPTLGRSAPTFLTHFPTAQAALARRSPADPRVAERFELFLCGLELANAYIELTDAAEQRTRFETDRTRRAALGGQSWPMDEALLAAMAHGLPPCGGVALGFDRLAMIASGAPRISDVLWGGEG